MRSLRAVSRGREAPAGDGEKVVAAPGTQTFFFLKNYYLFSTPPGGVWGSGGVWGGLGGQFGLERLIGGQAGSIPVDRIWPRASLGQFWTGLEWKIEPSRRFWTMGVAGLVIESLSL